MKHRLELFSDAVIAIVITIMVLDLHTPATGGWQAFVPILPSVGTYAIGFCLLGVSWLTRYRFFCELETFNRKMVWSNFAYLFVLSLAPLLVRNLADHPGDGADTVALILWCIFATIPMTLMRTASYGDNLDRPGFREWYEGTKRLGLLLYAMLLVQAAVACVWPRVGLAMLVMTYLWVVTKR